MLTSSNGESAVRMETRSEGGPNISWLAPGGMGCCNNSLKLRRAQRGQPEGDLEMYWVLEKAIKVWNRQSGQIYFRSQFYMWPTEMGAPRELLIPERANGQSTGEKEELEEIQRLRAWVAKTRGQIEPLCLVLRSCASEASYRKEREAGQRARGYPACPRG